MTQGYDFSRFKNFDSNSEILFFKSVSIPGIV
jgi:hypothetical protein